MAPSSPAAANGRVGAARRIGPRWALAIAVGACSLAVNALFAWNALRGAAPKTAVQLASPDRIEVIRTEGGLLQVSTIRAPETFQRSTAHTILGIDLGTTTTQIRVPATFHYHLPLAREWKVTVADDGSVVVVAPAVRPTLPVAIDTARLERFAAGIWSPLTGAAELDALQRSITQTLAVKASTPSYLQFQREAARRTVAEFVERWLLTQARWQQPGRPPTVRVFFADEPIAALGSVSPAWVIAD